MEQTPKRRPLRVGDHVRVIVPKRVVRVGYPKSLDDYFEEAKRMFASDVEALVQRARRSSRRLYSPAETVMPKSMYRILSELAFELARADRFGGPKRSLHFEDVPQLLGVFAQITELTTVKTGTYRPARASRGFEDEFYDVLPPGLDNEQTHRLAKVDGIARNLAVSQDELRPIPRDRFAVGWWFPTTHLKPWAPDDSRTAEEWRAAQATEANR